LSLYFKLIIQFLICTLPINKLRAKSFNRTDFFLKKILFFWISEHKGTTKLKTEINNEK